MAKYQLRLKSRVLRTKGESIKNIANNLGVSRSTVSWWVRDITLTPKQLNQLKFSEEKGKALGRIKSLQIKEAKRKFRINLSITNGKRAVGILVKRELLVTGLALYWAEGGKSFRNKRVEFCNSDPRMVKLFLNWLKVCLEVQAKDLRAVVGINEIHRLREQEVKLYWSQITGIPLAQFRKTSFKKTFNKKIYDNLADHKGTLSIVVARSTNLYYEIMGLIEGLASCYLRKDYVVCL